MGQVKEIQEKVPMIFALETVMGIRFMLKLKELV